MTQSDNQTLKTNQKQQDNTHTQTKMGVDVLGWVQAANPPDFDLPRKENPRRKLSEAYSVSVTMDQNAFGRFFCHYLVQPSLKLSSFLYIYAH